jgi:hypothetical protein
MRTPKELPESCRMNLRRHRLLRRPESWTRDVNDIFYLNFNISCIAFNPSKWISVWGGGESMSRTPVAWEHRHLAGFLLPFILPTFSVASQWLIHYSVTKTFKNKIIVLLWVKIQTNCISSQEEHRWYLVFLSERMQRNGAIYSRDA